MLNDLVENDVAMVGFYKICLVQNKRNIQVFLEEELIYSKPACWATYWEVEQLVKEQICQH